MHEAYLFAGKKIERTFTHQPNIDFACSLTDLEYLSHPIFESPHTMEEVLRWTAKAFAENSIPKERIWLGAHFDQEIETGSHPHFTVQKINAEVGLGVFAAEPILPHAFLGEYTGVIRQTRRRHEKESLYSFSYTAWRVGKNPHVLSAETMGNFTRFINHSDTPNCEALSVYWRGMPRIIFIAKKDILKGEQIFFDYGKIFWEAVPHIRKRYLG